MLVEVFEAATKVAARDLARSDILVVSPFKDAHERAKDENLSRPIVKVVESSCIYEQD